MNQNSQKITSTFEKRSNHLKKLIATYQKSLNQRNSLLLKHNVFLNNLRDSGRLSKEEIELYFKK
jgi:hypothetical protein